MNEATEVTTAANEVPEVTPSAPAVRTRWQELRLVLGDEVLPDFERQYALLGAFLIGAGLGARFANAAGETVDLSTVDWSDFHRVAGPMLNQQLDPDFATNPRASLPPRWVGRLLLERK